MQHKITLAWRGGTIGIENNRVAIRQGTNFVYIEQEQFDAFLVDVEAAMHNLPPPEPTSGYGGTIEKLPPKMDDIVYNLACLGKGWRAARK
jgi:hypothetical protein